MKSTLLILTCLAILQGCSEVTNNYTVNGSNNKIQATQTGSTERPVTAGASVSATAAASQTGEATNTGKSDAGIGGLGQ